MGSPSPSNGARVQGPDPRQGVGSGVWGGGRMETASAGSAPGGGLYGDSGITGHPPGKTSG